MQTLKDILSSGDTWLIVLIAFLASSVIWLGYHAYHKDDYPSGKYILQHIGEARFPSTCRLIPYGDSGDLKFDLEACDLHPENVR